MKFLLTCLVFILGLYNYTWAQNDNLIVTLKSGQVDTIAISQIQSIQFENITAVNEPINVNTNLRVDGNYPNPFSEQTSLEFEIAGSGSVEIIIYDNSGKQIQTLKCESCQTGKNSLLWNCLDANNNRVQNGVYYYEVRFGSEIQSRKMVVVK